MLLEERPTAAQEVQEIQEIMEVVTEAVTEVTTVMGMDPSLKNKKRNPKTIPIIMGQPQVISETIPITNQRLTNIKILLRTRKQPLKMKPRRKRGRMILQWRPKNHLKGWPINYQNLDKKGKTLNKVLLNQFLKAMTRLLIYSEVIQLPLLSNRILPFNWCLNHQNHSK